jgi:hypothetical protein
MSPLLEEIRWEFDEFMLGTLLSEGMYRRVFVTSWSDDQVMKIETKLVSGSQFFCNVREWTLWHDVRNDPHIAQWLAPCRRISSGGRILIQNRTGPLLSGKRYSVPDWIKDPHSDNFGLIGRRIVCHDYALVNQTEMRAPASSWGWVTVRRD